MLPLLSAYAGSIDNLMKLGKAPLKQLWIYTGIVRVF